MTLFNIGVTLVALVAGGIASVAGFGTGSLLTPLIALQYGMKTAAGAVAIPHIIATILRFWRLRAHIDRHVFLGFGLMNAGGVLVGALIHARVTSPVLTVVLGMLLIFAGIVGVSGYAERMRFNRKISWIAGAASGGFGGLVGNQGGIRSAAMLGLEVQGPAFVATATAIGLAVDTVRMPIYFATAAGRIFSAWPAIISGIIGVVIGTLAGERVLRRIPERTFRRVVSAILVAIGIVLVVVSS
jgi:uncharacterized membrane protein YfcA